MAWEPGPTREVAGPLRLGQASDGQKPSCPAGGGLGTGCGLRGLRSSARVRRKPRSTASAHGEGPAGRRAVPPTAARQAQGGHGAGGPRSAPRPMFRASSLYACLSCPGTRSVRKWVVTPGTQCWWGTAVPYLSWPLSWNRGEGSRSPGQATSEAQTLPKAKLSVYKHRCGAKLAGASRAGKQPVTVYPHFLLDSSSTPKTITHLTPLVRPGGTTRQILGTSSQAHRAPGSLLWWAQSARAGAPDTAGDHARLCLCPSARGRRGLDGLHSPPPPDIWHQPTSQP